MKKHYIKTPLFKSYTHSTLFDVNIQYKMECFQPSGSFKIRGMDTFLKELSGQGYTKVIASSGGNAGYSLAYIGKQMGISIQLIVPKTTSQYMIDKIKLMDAEVIVYGQNWNEAHAYATQRSIDFNLPYVPPFDHPLLWKGHSSIIDECAIEMEEPDKIIVAVGGGGLLCGIFEGLIKNNWLKTTVITAETEGAASFAKSFEIGKCIELDTIDTIATSLGAKKITKKALEYSSFKIETYVTDDKSAFTACKDFFDEYHTLVEPACGAALSYVKNNAKKLKPKENILVIVCGGVNMGRKLFNEYSNRYQ